jgi:hypothetical protein
MTTTIELIDQAKKIAGCESDYSFAKKFGFPIQTVSNWRHGRTFDDAAAEVIAEILHREPGELMAISQAQRAKDDKSRARWLRVAALLAAAVLPPAASGGIGTTSYNNAPYVVVNADLIGIMSTRLRRFIRRLVSAPGYRLA